MPTLAEIQVAIKELAFDRFPVPAVVLKAKPNHTLTVDGTSLRIVTGTTDVVNDSYTTFPTQEALFQDVIAKGCPLAFLGYFRGSCPNTDLMPLANAVMSSDITLLRKSYYNADDIANLVLGYAIQVLKYAPTTTVADLPGIIADMDANTVYHMSLWSALMQVEERRMSDFAGALMKGYFSDGSGMVMAGGFNAGNVWNDGDTVNINIGSVFSMQDNAGSGSSQYAGDNTNPARIGADNVLEDWASFWWKLFLWLRDKLEQKFNDFSFRKETGMWTKAVLDKPLNYRTYYDSYPFTLSAITRYILS